MTQEEISVEKEKIANIIEGRILSEQKKHKSLNWIKIASLKIASDILNRDQITAKAEREKSLVFIEENDIIKTANESLNKQISQLKEDVKKLQDILKDTAPLKDYKFLQKEIEKLKQYIKEEDMLRQEDSKELLRLGEENKELSGEVDDLKDNITLICKEDKEKISQLKKEIICLNECEGAYAERINELQKENIELKELLADINLDKE